MKVEIISSKEIALSPKHETSAENSVRVVEDAKNRVDAIDRKAALSAQALEKFMALVKQAQDF